MKTFDEKDLITWANRHDVKVGDKGYFADSITDLHSNMKANFVHELMSIFDNNNRCFSDGTFSYGFFLPVDAVKEDKKYRACKTIKEFYELVFDTKSKAEESFYIEELLGASIHLRNKETETEYFTTISAITKDINDYVKVVVSPIFNYLSFTDLFNKYEIEIDGEWKPFGVIDED